MDGQCDAGENAKSDAVADEQIILIVHRTLNDNARPEGNVIVCGLPETDYLESDHRFCIKIRVENLPTKPHITRINCLKRLSKKSTAERRLLVRLDCAAAANELWRVAPMLRRSNDRWIAGNIFICLSIAYSNKTNLRS